MGRSKRGLSRINLPIFNNILLPLIILIIIPLKCCLAAATSSSNNNNNNNNNNNPSNYTTTTTEYRQAAVSSLRLARIHKHLEKINKPPPVFTIQSPDGDLIDCVHKRRQPALDHPLLKHHKIQRVPSAMPKAKDDADETNTTKSIDGLKGVWQMWHQKGQLCPKGTVPIRRSSVHDVLRAKSLYDFGKKQTRPLSFHGRRNEPTNDDLNTNNHEHAIAYVTSEGIYGAKASINVWDPSVEGRAEFSLSQIWVLSGSFDGTDLNSVEAGWQSDAYESTGCYNLLCSGFVQTNSRIAIGAAISPVSSLHQTQYDITILIWKDPKTKNWWMAFGDNTLVGYWPNELFTHLSHRATMVEWGGEVVNTRPKNKHTSTQMGSGHFAEGGFGTASYFRNLQIVGSDNGLVTAHDIRTLAEHVNCYNIQSSYSRKWGTYFYYGGPGRSPKCP